MAVREDAGYSTVGVRCDCDGVYHCVAGQPSQGPSAAAKPRYTSTCVLIFITQLYHVSSLLAKCLV